MTKLFVYGTLKKRFFNHTRFKFDKKTKFISKAVLKGYTMYSLGSYPCIVKSNDNSLIQGEIYKYTNSKCENAIKRMEENAGYTEIIVKINNIDVKTFVFDKQPNNNIIIDGV